MPDVVSSASCSQAPTRSAESGAQQSDPEWMAQLRAAQAPSGLRGLSQAERAHLELAHRVDKLESLSRMAGCLAHDFNNILLAIGANAEFALFDCDPRSAVHDSLQEILGATRRAASQCERLLAYAGRGRYARAPVALGEELQQLALQLRGQLPVQVALELELPDVPLPPIEGDAARLRELLGALVANAVEALGEAGGTLRLRLELLRAFEPELGHTPMGGSLGSGQYLRLELLDDGPGMDAEVLAKAFEPFFSTRMAGRGLGLSAAAGIVQAHGGHIELFSKPGHGTLVEVLLPHCALASAPVEGAEPGARVEGSSAWRGEGRALVIDDDPLPRAAARRLLERLGFEVCEAEGGAEALELLRAEEPRFACVLLDLTMPGMDGHECLAQLRELQPELPVLVTSGYSERELEDSSAGFLPKPYELEVLRSRLRGLLADASH